MIAFTIEQVIPNWLLISVLAFGVAVLLVAIFVK